MKLEGGWTHSVSLENGRIVKRFSNARDYGTELAAYRLLRDIGHPVSEILDCCDRRIEFRDDGARVRETCLPDDAARMGFLLGQLHALEVTPDALPRLSGSPQRDLIPIPVEVCVTHGDIAASNTVFHGEWCRFIDWETCQVADPLADLAVATVELALETSPAIARVFAAGYDESGDRAARTMKRWRDDRETRERLCNAVFDRGIEWTQAFRPQSTHCYLDQRDAVMKELMS